MLDSSIFRHPKLIDYLIIDNNVKVYSMDGQQSPVSLETILATSKVYFIRVCETLLCFYLPAFYCIVML